MLDICHTSLGTLEFGVGTFVLTLSAGIIANRMTADRACGVGPHRRAWIGLGVGAARASVPAG